MSAGVLSEAQLSEQVADISSLPRKITETLKLENQAQEIGASLVHATDTYFSVGEFCIQSP